MLKEMRYPVLACVFVSGADVDPDPDGDGSHVRNFLGYDADSVGKNTFSVAGFLYRPIGKFHTRKCDNDVIISLFPRIINFRLSARGQLIERTRSPALRNASLRRGL